jgi:hypothetical protein
MSDQVIIVDVPKKDEDVAFASLARINAYVIPIDAVGKLIKPEGLEEAICIHSLDDVRELLEKATDQHAA